MEKVAPWSDGDPKRFTYLYQENFFHLLRQPEFKVIGQPTRTMSTFWNSDILPTAIKIRKINVHNYQDADGTVLEYVWNWLKNAKNEKLIKEGSLADKETFEQLPTEVVLNSETAYFFAMHSDFKRNLKFGLFEPFVAYKPETPDWENDIRRITFKFTTGLSERPLEIPGAKNKEPLNPVTEAILKRVHGDKEMVEKYEGINAITWVVLMKYHLELLRRENVFFE